MSEITVSITVQGDRRSGKSTVLEIAKKALITAGFKVSEIQVYGDEVIREYITVTTANVTTRTEWLSNNKEK